LTPRKLAPALQSLPPILHIPIQHPVSSYSKGARGLSVLMRAPGFFTGTTNSLSIPPRQRSSRYAIHAGRNFMCFHSFLWHRLYVHLTQVIEKPYSVLEMVRAGVLWSEWLHPGISTPESLRGSCHHDLTLGITRGAPASTGWASPI
jgi:hypothetical protein